MEELLQPETPAPHSPDLPPGGRLHPGRDNVRRPPAAREPARNPGDTDPSARALHLWLLLPSRGRPLVAVETHVAAQPLLRIKHLAAILADVGAPSLWPVCGAPILLVTVGNTEEGRMGEWDSVLVMNSSSSSFFFLWGFKVWSTDKSR